MGKSLKKQLKEWDTLIKGSEKINEENPYFKLETFISHLKEKRDKVAAQIGKRPK